MMLEPSRLLVRAVSVARRGAAAAPSESRPQRLELELQRGRQIRVAQRALAEAGPAAVEPPFHSVPQSGIMLAISPSTAQFQVTPGPLPRVRLLPGRSNHCPLPSANGTASRRTETRRP